MRTTLDRHERYAAQHYREGRGHVYLEECLFCGYLSWQKTAIEEPKALTVESMRALTCPRCTEVFHRAPEIASWVLGVVEKVQEDMAGEGQ
jgi:hypothetical protein